MDQVISKDFEGKSKIWLVLKNFTDTLGGAFLKLAKNSGVDLIVAERPHPLINHMHIKLVLNNNTNAVEILQKQLKTEKKWWQDVLQDFKSSNPTIIHDLSGGFFRLSNFDYARANMLRRACLEYVGGVFVAYEATARKNTTVFTEETIARRVAQIPITIKTDNLESFDESENVINLKVIAKRQQSEVMSSELVCTRPEILSFPQDALVAAVSEGQEIDMSFKVRTRPPEQHTLYRAVSYCTYVDSMYLEPQKNVQWSTDRIDTLVNRINYLFKEVAVKKSKSGIEIASKYKKGNGVFSDHYSALLSILKSSKNSTDEKLPVRIVASESQFRFEVETDGRKTPKRCLKEALEAVIAKISKVETLLAGKFNQISETTAMKYEC